MFSLKKKCLSALLLTLLAFGLNPARGVAADQPYRVLMLLWNGKTEVERGFEEAMAEFDLPVEFIWRDAARDRARIPALVAEAKALRPDLICTWGAAVTLGVAGESGKADPATQITDIPVLFTMVPAPLESGLVTDLSAPERNVTGTTQRVPVEAQIKAIRAYRPLTRLGVLYNPADPISVANVRRLRELSAPLQFELLDQPVPLDKQGKPRAAALPELVGRLARREPQFLYIGPDAFIGEHRQRLIDQALRYRLPAFSASELDMRDSRALVGLVSRFYHLGRLTARKARQILVEKKNPRDIPVESLSRFSYIINRSVAKRLALYPPMSVLSYAEVID
ncbi:MAG: ABC transporter substrate-binding protein [Candidatus Competibacteraceae bacterium]|nr:ABC transporter substrate-binding protein [Candidatus Competibacteraceae bacterium]